MHGNYPLMPNRVLSEMINTELLKLGGISYNEEEMAYAQELYKTLPTLHLEKLVLKNKFNL